jgi:energy-coupling factor transport system permease protein
MKQAFHPRSMVVYLFILFLLALLYDHMGLLTAMLLGLALINLSLDRARSWFKMLGYALPFGLFLLIVNVAINQEGAVWWAWQGAGLRLAVHGPAVVYGLTMTLRLMVVLSIFTAFNHLLSVEELLEVFPNRRGTAIIVAAVTARMAPDLSRRVRGIQEIQMVRCLDPGRTSLLERCRRTGILVINLLRAALDGAWKSAEVMQARGYGAAPRTSYRQRRWRDRDNWLVAASWSAFMLALVFNPWTAISGHNLIWGGALPLTVMAAALLVLAGPGLRGGRSEYRSDY